MCCGGWKVLAVGGRMALIYASLLETNAGPKRAQTSNTDNASRHVIYKMIYPREKKRLMLVGITRELTSKHRRKKTTGHEERCYSSSTINHSVSDSRPSPAEIVSHPSSPLRLPPHSHSRFPTRPENRDGPLYLQSLPGPLLSSRTLDVASACPRRNHLLHSCG